MLSSLLFPGAAFHLLHIPNLLIVTLPVSSFCLDTICFQFPKGIHGFDKLQYNPLYMPLKSSPHQTYLTTTVIGYRLSIFSLLLPHAPHCPAQSCAVNFSVTARYCTGQDLDVRSSNCTANFPSTCCGLISPQ